MRMNGLAVAAEEAVFAMTLSPRSSIVDEILKTPLRPGSRGPTVASVRSKHGLSHRDAMALLVEMSEFGWLEKTNNGYRVGSRKEVWDAWEAHVDGLVAPCVESMAKAGLTLEDVSLAVARRERGRLELKRLRGAALAPLLRRLIRLRIAKKVAQEELGQRAGLDWRNVSRIERSLETGRGIDQENFEKYARPLGYRLHIDLVPLNYRVARLASVPNPGRVKSRLSRAVTGGIGGRERR